jgi:signal transduction histidine kinase
MRLKAKLLVLAAVPLLLSLALIVVAVLHQERELVQREHALVKTPTWRHAASSCATMWTSASAP